MPTYDYKCDDCGYAFEKFQRFSEDRLTDCPECGRATLRRLFGTGAAVLFKGSGFYETDYRSDSYKDAAKKESESSGGSKSESKGGESKGESKSPPPPAAASGDSGGTAKSGD